MPSTGASQKRPDVSEPEKSSRWDRQYSCSSQANSYPPTDRTQKELVLSADETSFNQREHTTTLNIDWRVEARLKLCHLAGERYRVASLIITRLAEVIVVPHAALTYLILK